MPKPTTRTIRASDAREQWDQVIDGVARSRTRVIVERDGATVAAIISAKDFEWLNYLEAERERDFAIVDEIREAFKDQTPEQIEREVAKAIAEAREEIRREARDRRSA